MEFKDAYATLGVAHTATQDVVKRAYRKLARKYHPDVIKEPDAEARFKEVAEAHEALIDAERRAAYDDIAQRHAKGEAFEPPPDWDSGYEFSGRRDPADGSMPGRRPTGRGGAGEFSDFFESLFGRGGRNGACGGFGSAEDGGQRGAGRGPVRGRDHHAKVAIDLLDAYQGAQRTVSLRMPVVDATTRQTSLQERQLEVGIPKGMRKGQHLRLTGQGTARAGGAPSGNLYLEIQILPHPLFRLDGGGISFDLPLAPWEAPLGATVTAPTPDRAGRIVARPRAAAQGQGLARQGARRPLCRTDDGSAALGFRARARGLAGASSSLSCLPPALCTGGLKTMAENFVLTTASVVVEEHLSFTLSALCRAGGAEQDLVQGLVDEGLLHPSGQGPYDWHFGGDALPQTRRPLRSRRNFELDLAALSLVMDLLGEIEHLRLRRTRSCTGRSKPRRTL